MGMARLRAVGWDPSVSGPAGVRQGRRARGLRALAPPAFARAARALCERTGAVLVLDDVRAGFRFDVTGTWEPLGVRPDLSAFSAAIANGHPLAAVTGIEVLRPAAHTDADVDEAVERAGDAFAALG
jgi:4-aminobutyrate aminotransferase-like enzyme